MTSILLGKIKTSQFFNFNQVCRDQWVARQAALLPARSLVLDVGAGSSPYRPFFAHCDYRTQDFGGLKGHQLRSGSYGKIDYLCDATEIPVGDDVFDMVICTEVLEHVENPAGVVQEVARVLKSGGRLLLSAPLGSGIHQEPYHYYGGFTPFWYETVLPRHGLFNIQVEANHGSFKAFSQESLRFLQMTMPFSLSMPWPVELVWTLVWIGLLPLLGVFIPLTGHWLDRFDRERRFTVGYHVTAVKARSPDQQP